MVVKCEKISMEETPIISGREGDLRILISPAKSNTTGIVMGHSTLKSSEILSLHVHDYSDEVFYVLSGQGKVITNHGDLFFKKNDAVLIPKGTAHKIENTSHDDLSVVFCVAPLAPNPEAGHRIIQENQMEIDHEKFN